MTVSTAKPWMLKKQCSRRHLQQSHQLKRNFMSLHLPKKTRKGANTATPRNFCREERYKDVGEGIQVKVGKDAKEAKDVNDSKKKNKEKKVKGAGKDVAKEEPDSDSGSSSSEKTKKK